MLNISPLKLKEEKSSDQRILGLAFAIVNKILAAHGFNCGIISAEDKDVALSMRLPLREGASTSTAGSCAGVEYSVNNPD